MRFFILIIILIMHCVLSFASIKLDLGITMGLEQNIYDSKEASFKAKYQYGGGFNTYFRILFNNFAGAELGIPGFFYTFKSDTEGGYYYPEKIKVPWSLKIKFFVEVNKYYFDGGGGIYLPFYFINSYYHPRYLMPGAGADIGIGYEVFKNIFLGGRIELVSYFDPYASLNFSSYYLLNLAMRVF